MEARLETSEDKNHILSRSYYSDSVEILNGGFTSLAECKQTGFYQRTESYGQQDEIKGETTK